MIADRLRMIQAVSGGGGGGATLPVSGAALWLDGADSSTLFTDAGVTPVSTAGDLIYQWSDKSGNNRHATQVTSASRPTWVPPEYGQNGIGGVAIDGVSYKGLVLSDFISTYKTFFIVHKGVSSSLDTRLITANADFKVNVGASSSSGGNLSFVREYVTWTNSGFSRIYDTTLFNVTYADSPTFSAKLEKYTASGLMLIQSITSKGSGTSPQGFGQPGNYYEIIAFDRSLSESEILAINTYLKAKWNILLLNLDSLILNMQGTAGGTTFVDESPNALAVTRNGDTVLVSDATFGTVASFDGSGDYLTLAGSGGQFAFGTSPFTIEFWLYPLDITTRQGLYSNNINSSSGIGSGPVFAIRGLGQTGKLGVGNVGQADKVETGQNVLLLNTWQHIALIREGTGTNQTKIYIDGVLQGQGTMSDNYSVSRDAALGRTIYYSEYFNGLIGPARITKGVARYTANFTPPTGLFPTS